MIALTRKTDYALVALAYLGQRRHAGAGAVSARRIADQFSLPLPLLMNILKELTQAKIVTSVRGSQGGYALALEPDAVRLSDIIEAMEGPVRLAACAQATHGDTTTASHAPAESCGLISTCPVREPIRRLNQRIHQFFQMTTLADLLDSKADLNADAVQLRVQPVSAAMSMIGNC